MDHSHHHHPVPSSTPAPSIMDDTTTSSASHHGHESHQMGTGMGMDMVMMTPYFHFDFGDTILFQNIVLTDTERTIICCVLFFLIGFLYEGLKVYRELLLRKTARQCTSYPVISASIEGDTEGTNPSEERGRGDFLARGPKLSCREQIFNVPHVVQSLLHILQVAISYVLMLAFMSFNGFLAISILLGAGTGYFTFCWRKLSVVDLEHCN